MCVYVLLDPLARGGYVVVAEVGVHVSVGLIDGADQVVAVVVVSAPRGMSFPFLVFEGL